MLFRQQFWPGIADGSIRVAFRRWRRPTVKAGGTLRSPAGVLAIDAVEPLAGDDDLTEAEARAAGHASLADLRRELAVEGTLYRIRFHLAGDDPRVALREDADLDDGALAEVERALGRLSWSRAAIAVIARHPATVSSVLADEVGVDRPTFKRRVRRLKELGLTESLGTGYRLSPRGETVAAHLGISP